MKALTFLAVADLHYTTKPVSGTRYHAQSLQKLRGGMETWSGQFDFLANMGDATDAVSGYLPQEECFRAAYEMMASAGVPVYSVIGNHDTATEKSVSTALLHMPGRYYAVEEKGFLCVFLDGSLNDPKDPEKAGLIDWENCWIDDAQLAWLSCTLHTSQKPVLIFCHPCFALKDGWAEDLHLIQNRRQVMELFSDCGRVAGVFCGHYHEGDCQIVDGIPYITFAAVCEGTETTGALVTVTEKEISAQGIGHQQSLCVPCGIRQIPEKGGIEC